MTPECPCPALVVLSGAGISKESGLETFRDKGGVWEKYDPNNVATPEGYRANPSLVHEFYNARRAELRSPSIMPNAAHKALARLSSLWTAPCTIVTQNIDDLHERSGSSNVVHIHGEVSQSLCSVCGMRKRVSGDLSVESRCCECGGGLRPDVVWFGETPYHLPLVYSLLADCGIFIAIGTSGRVYPAAAFVSEARSARTIEINAEGTEVSSLFDEHRLGRASLKVPILVEELLQETTLLGGRIA